ncbi:MAG: citrate synthase [bacterium]|nr:citrate synthase [bacterium]
MNNENYAELILDGKSHKYPIITGSENEKAIDISTLRKDTGYITLDPSFINTGACKSEITYIDGEKGILRYRGIPIEELAEKSTFVETAYLLLNGDMPTEWQLNRVSEILRESSLLHEDMLRFLDTFPSNAHPMNTLSTMINALSSFYPNVDSQSLEGDVYKTSAQLISVFRTVAAFSYKKSIGEPIVYPRHDLSYCANFLNMMFDSPVKPYKIESDVVEILNKLLIIHADHEQNCSTTAVRVIGSAQVNLFSTLSAGINALSGPLHGGANQKVIEMLNKIENDGGNIDKFIEKAKDKNDPFKLMGFGHRVYKNFDPRANIIKDSCHKLLNKLDINDSLLTTAMKLEEKALSDDYFVSRKLFPNVDFYSGIIYKALDIPVDMFTVMFAIGRLPGWIAQWKEMVDSKNRKIARPRQIYTGAKLTHIPE